MTEVSPSVLAPAPAVVGAAGEKAVGLIDESHPDFNDPVQRLARRIEAVLAKDADDVAGVKALMEEYASSGHTDWKGYARFSPVCYARNLVNKSELFELIVLCWNGGQVSPVHNHAGQHCWALCLEGEMQERHFAQSCGGITECVAEDKTQPCPLKAGDIHTLRAGECGYIDDGIALHELGPAPDTGRGITLHCYSKPITECNVYCQATASIQKHKSGYFTIGKKEQADVPTPPCYGGPRE